MLNFKDNSLRVYDLDHCKPYRDVRVWNIPKYMRHSTVAITDVISLIEAACNADKVAEKVKQL